MDRFKTVPFPRQELAANAAGYSTLTRSSLRWFIKALPL
jgi:hypothetical protein